jgi:hypothetical protein
MLVGRGYATSPGRLDGIALGDLMVQLHATPSHLLFETTNYLTSVPYGSQRSLRIQFEPSQLVQLVAYANVDRTTRLTVHLVIEKVTTTRMALYGNSPACGSSRLVAWGGFKRFSTLERGSHPLPPC